MKPEFKIGEVVEDTKVIKGINISGSTTFATASQRADAFLMTIGVLK